MWPALISAGATLLGGALNRRENRRREELTDPATIRRKAEAAGFNPLEFTGAAFQQPNYAPGVGSAMMDAGAMMLQEHGRQQAYELQVQELELANRRLTQLAEAATLRPTYGGPYSRSGSNGSDDPADTDGVLPIPTDAYDRPIFGRGGVRIFGGDVAHNENFSDAENYEQRYGEAGEFFGGVVNLGADAYTAGQNWGRDHFWPRVRRGQEQAQSREARDAAEWAEEERDLYELNRSRALEERSRLNSDAHRWADNLTRSDPTMMDPASIDVTRSPVPQMRRLPYLTGSPFTN